VLRGVSLFRKVCFGNRVAVINMIRVTPFCVVMPYLVLWLTRDQLHRINIWGFVSVYTVIQTFLNFSINVCLRLVDACLDTGNCVTGVKITCFRKRYRNKRKSELS
jgi:hypothetical protein